MRAFDEGYAVAEIRNFLLKAVSHCVAAAEIGGAADENLRSCPGQRIGDVLFVSIRPSETQFIQEAGRERGQQLRAKHVSAVAEIRRHAERIQAANIRVERIAIP